MASSPTLVTIDGEVQLDASVSERHAAAVELTRHPVEEGASPADHARELPDRLSIEAVVTNTPIGRTVRESRGDSEPRKVGYAQEVYRWLLALKSERRAVAVVTAFREYTDMVLVSLDAPRDASIGDAVRVSLVFEQVRFVTNERARLARPNAIPRKPIASVNQRKKPAEPVSAAKRSSIAKSLADSLGITSAGGGVTP